MAGVETPAAVETPTRLAHRRANRWRRKRRITEGGDDEANYVNPNRVDLVNSIKNKDAIGVKRMLQDLTSQESMDDLSTAVDEYAISVMEHVVRAGSTEVLEEVLAVCKTATDKWNSILSGMLFAIRINDIDMCHYFLRLQENESAYVNDQQTTNVPSDAKGTGRKVWWWKQDNKTSSTRISNVGEREFSEDITPIVLAAQLERTEIIRLLLDESDPNIHPLTEIPTSSTHVRSSCFVCQEESHFVGRQKIQECKKAIEVYKALSSPAYMFQAGVRDPILEAFNISNIMEKRKLVDPAFVEEYDQISQKCKSFCLELLDLCRTNEEVTTLLNYDNGIKQTHPSRHRAKLPRLVVAMFYNQKEFIAHPTCQQVLQNIWFSGLPKWVCRQSAHMPRLLLYTFLLAVTMPVAMLLYLLRVPCVRGLVRQPVTKFLFDVITFLVFLCLLFANASQSHVKVRGDPPAVLEGLIMVWVAGYTLRLCRVLYRRHCFYATPYKYVRSTMYGGISLLFFWLYFGIKLGVYAADGVGGGGGGDVETRLAWKWYHPSLWGEVFYSLACALSVVNIYTFFKASSTLGPLQISLKAMLFDVGQFFIVFLVVLSAFSIALTTLNIGYCSRYDPDGPEFCSLKQSYAKLYWNMFGYGDPSDVIILVNATMNNSLHTKVRVEHDMTEGIGTGLYGFYHLFVIIVLLNMLIAMMANTYNIVVKNSLTEWRFARTRLILSYLNDVGVMVPPFNILPIRVIIGLFTKTFFRCCKNTAEQDDWSVMNYEVFVECLSKRYWRKREHKRRQNNKKCE